MREYFEIKLEQKIIQGFKPYLLILTAILSLCFLLKLQNNNFNVRILFILALQ